MKPICLGLDLGSVTLGLALSDGLGLLAHPLVTLRYPHNEMLTLIEPLSKIIVEHKVEKLVLGLPKHMNNDIGEKAEYCLKFKEILEDNFDLEVIMIDERWSTLSSLKMFTVSGVKANKRKAKIDQAAAVEILQRYLDMNK